MILSENSLTTWDGTEIFYRAWIPAANSGKALLLFHRGHEHSGRWQETVDSLNLPDISVFAWDARGHGRSPGERGAAGSLTDIIRDIDTFVRHISEQYGIPVENMIVLGHSLAAVTIAAWIHDYGPRIRAMILATAAFQVKLYVPFAIPALRIGQKSGRSRRVTSYVRSSLLTRESAEAEKYNADPLIFRQISVNVLLDLHDTARRLIADAGAINTPTLMVAAGCDWIVSLKAQHEFFARLSSPIKEMQTYSHARHAIFHDTDRTMVIDSIRRFVCERFAETPALPSLLHADRAGYTRDEFDRLRFGRPLKFSVARLGLRAAGRFSRGVNIGWRSGFDSGLSLDYVYQNKPAGVTPVGRLIDKSYLNSIGWRGIRQRKVNLKAALTGLILQLHRLSRPVRILDVAAGAGRYIIEALHELNYIPATALLRDYRQENVEAARALAHEFELINVTVQRGDAFDATALAAIEPKATIGVVSGLYELFPSNDAVLRSLSGLVQAIEPGGYLIYTNQPWHPQVEFIARVLRNREGEPWIMRRRTTAEIDELVQTSGFNKLSMELDQWGMFSVSVAQRNA